jgi:hypothetical protein
VTGERFTVIGEVWLHAGDAGWHFLTLPDEVADEIRARRAGSGPAFGSVAARVTLGATSWATSLFADAKSSSYLLPLKAQVRRLEGVVAGDTVSVLITLNG